MRRSPFATVKRPDAPSTVVGHLYILRHGQTTCNADQVIQGPRVDAFLSELGVRQARALGGAFSSTPLRAVYTSPLSRARQTTQSVVDAQRTPPAPEVVPELYELDYGVLCGRPLPEVRAQVTQVLDAWGLGFVDTPFPGGESPVLAQHRVRAFAGRLHEEALDHDVAVVAHGRINRVLVTTLLGLPLTEMPRFPQSNANITHLEARADGWTVRRVNDTSHLDEDPSPSGPDFS